MPTAIEWQTPVCQKSFGQYTWFIIFADYCCLKDKVEQSETTLIATGF